MTAMSLMRIGQYVYQRTQLLHQLARQYLFPQSYQNNHTASAAYLDRLSP
jgi:hypothetical protein